jgi:hypothetical protein
MSVICVTPILSKFKYKRGNQAAVKRIIDSVHQGSKRNLTRLQNGGEVYKNQENVPSKK